MYSKLVKKLQGDNETLASHFLSLFEDVLAEHFAEDCDGISIDFADRPAVLLRRPEEVETLLREHLPGCVVELLLSVLLWTSAWR
jgi:hypothetical protein